VATTRMTRVRRFPQPSLRRLWRWGSVGALVALGLSPSPVYADDLSVLVFPVVIWPVALVLMLVMGILTTLALRRRSKTANQPNVLGPASMLFSALVMLVYPGWAFALGADASRGDVAVWLITLLPVLGMAVGCMVTGFYLRKARPRRPTRRGDT